MRGRDRPLAGEPQHFAVRRDAARREPSRDEVHPPVEIVRRADVHEPALNGRLAEEHRGDWPLARQLLDARPDDLVEAGEAVGRAAPDDLHRPVLRIEPAHSELECAILHDEPPGEDGGEDRRAAHHPGSDEHEALAARPEAGPGEAQREGDPAQHHQWQSTGV